MFNCSDFLASKPPLSPSLLHIQQDGITSEASDARQGSASIFRKILGRSQW
jgi:hypothetical protein